MSEQDPIKDLPEIGELTGGHHAPADLLRDPIFRARFEQTSAALEAADLVRRMRRQALAASGARGINQDELARRTGLSQPRISQIENGNGRDGVSYAVMRKIAYACGIDWGQLLRHAITAPTAGETAEPAGLPEILRPAAAPSYTFEDITAP